MIGNINLSVPRVVGINTKGREGRVGTKTCHTQVKGNGESERESQLKMPKIQTLKRAAHD